MPFRPFVLAAALLLPVAMTAAPVLADGMKIGGQGFQLIQAVKDNDRAAFGKIASDNNNQLNTAVLDFRSDGETALHVAVRLNRVSFVNDLLYFGANPNLVSGAGETPLTMAVIARNPDLVELLFKGKAQVDVPNRRGETPLIKAVQLHYVELVQTLLQRGANPDKTDFTGKSARTYGADPRFPAIAKALADAPARTSRPVAGPKL